MILIHELLMHYSSIINFTNLPNFIPFSTFIAAYPLQLKMLLNIPFIFSHYSKLLFIKTNHVLDRIFRN